MVYDADVVGGGKQHQLGGQVELQASWCLVG